MKDFAEYIESNLIVDHPAFNDDKVLITEPINELYSSVRRILLMRETGCCFTAQSGVGKTRALKMLEHLLLERMPNLVVYRHNSWNHQMPSIRGFFKHFLTSVAHHEKRGETFDLRQRLVLRLQDVARTRNSPIVVFLIDEANAMELEDFLFLKDIYNELDLEGIRLITIMMGQEPDFNIVLDMLREKERFDLLARFARRQLTFRPLRTKEDLLGIFEQYDSTFYPSGSGQSWTEYFMRNAYESGFRMVGEADAFLAALQELLGRKKIIGFPARQCFTAIRAYLLDQAAKDSPGRRPRPDEWIDAINYALLAQATREMKIEGKRRQGVQI